MGEGSQRNLPCPCKSGKKYKKCCLIKHLKQNDLISNSKDSSAIKFAGTTPSERYLGRLCGKTFLSMWSNLCVYRKKGKELCDLLVVFGDDILIFSDKNCEFKMPEESEDIKLNWNRWFKRAIVKSAYQAWGAERILKQNPKIFLDSNCLEPLPLSLPEKGKERFHLIVVAHGTSEPVKKFYGDSGTGSLLINSELKGVESHIEPFYVGDLDSQKTFIHIFDDDSLDTLMGIRDTVSDFIDYLNKREILMRSPRKILATGEEELLAIYLKNLNENKEHDFIFPEKGEEVTHIALSEGFWESFQKNPQRLAQIKEDKISYAWDRLIETFNEYALGSSQYYVSSGGFRDNEKILRFMAAEPRFMRRYFSQQLKDMLQNTSKTQRRLRVMPPVREDRPYYIFLLFPMPPKNMSISFDEYRDMRRHFLSECCMVVKFKYKDAKDIVGIATESGLDNMGRSEDACYLDARKWDGKMEEAAEKAHVELEILKNFEYHSSHISEYPTV